MIENKEKITVGIVGSRSITDKDHVFSILDFCLSRLLQEHEIVICSGGAVGIDTMAEDFAEQKGLKTEIFLPNYTEYGKSATFVRNQLIVDNSDYLIAITTGSKGTASTIRMAKKKDIPIKIIKIRSNKERNSELKYLYTHEEYIPQNINQKINDRCRYIKNWLNER